LKKKKKFSFLGMPEWMDDNNDGDNQLSSATFEQDGTFTGSSSLRQNNNSNEQQKFQSQSSIDETSTRGNLVSYKKKSFCKFLIILSIFKVSSKQQEDNKPEKSTPPQADTAVVNVPTASVTLGKSFFFSFHLLS
jgi:hypothetical protein